MDAQTALRIVYGLEPIEDMETAFAAFDFLSDNPHLLTNGQACRGFENLKAILFNDA